MQLLLNAKTRKYIEVHVHEPESTWHANVNGDVATTGRGKVRKEGTPPASATRERERVESIPAPRHSPPKAQTKGPERQSTGARAGDPHGTCGQACNDPPEAGPSILQHEAFWILRLMQVG